MDISGPTDVMVTGHRQLRHPRTVAARLDEVFTKLEVRTAISGGAEGADTLFAEAAVRAGAALHLMFPNRWYRAKYPRAVSDDIIDAARDVTYVVDRPDVADWSDRWTSERWWRDNFARNTAMITAAQVAVVVSPTHPRALMEARKGGTSHAVAEICRRGDVAVVWVPDDRDGVSRWVKLRGGQRGGC